MREPDAPIETPTKAHHQRWRTGDVVAMGLAAALIVGSAGTGIFATARALETATASTTSTPQVTATPDTTSQARTSRDGYAGQAIGGSAGGYGGPGGYAGRPGTRGTTTATLDTTAATDAQPGGVVVIDTQLAYQDRKSVV